MSVFYKQLNYLKELSNRFPIMSDVRGRGTLLAWNHETPQQRDEIIGRKFKS